MSKNEGENSYENVKKTLIISMVFCAAFCLLNTGIMQPIQMAQAQSVMAESLIDVQQISENVYVVSMGDIAITVELFENGHRISTVSEDGEVMTYEVTTEFRPVSNANLESASRNAELVEKVVLLNGTELDTAMSKLVPQQHVEFPFESSQMRGNTNYWWDQSVYFVEGQYIDYPHPDRDYYGTRPADDWWIEGDYLVHFQLNKAVSQTLSWAGPEVIGITLGLLIGAKIGSWQGALALAGLGLLLGLCITYVMNAVLVDEEECLWFWVSRQFADWFDNWFWYIELLMDINAPIAMLAIEEQLMSGGYFRVGDQTFMDMHNFGGPHPPTWYYALSQVPFASGGGAYYSNEGNILGTANGQYATLYSGSFGNKAEITVTMSNTPISGQLYVRCYTPTNTGANFKVYVCNQYGVWNPNPVVNTNLYPPGTPMTYDCGYVNNIVKVSIVAYHEYNGCPSYINVDAVCVVN